MSDITSKGTHYMSFYHSASGVTRGSWTLVLLKNGEENRDVEINIMERPNNYYTVSFKNDGTNNSIWQVFAKEPSVEKVYTESWRVKDKTLENNVQQIRSRMDSDGGYFSTGGSE